MAESFKYDAFLSHSSKDKPAVRELAERLRKDGLRVWLDDWEIKPGDPILLKIEEGLEHSRTLVLVMSAHASASEWVTFERHAVMFRDPTNEQRRFIPVRLDEYLNKQDKLVKQLVFDGEPFTAQSVWRMRDRVLTR